MSDFIQEAEEYVERVAGGLGKKIETFVEDVEILFDADVLPVVKTAIALLLSQVGQAGAKAALASAPVAGAEAISGNVGGALVTVASAAGAAMLSAAEANAAADVAPVVKAAENAVEKAAEEQIKPTEPSAQ